MVIRNVALRMSGPDVDGWDDEVNPELVREELVGVIETAVQTSTMQSKAAPARVHAS